MPRRKLSDLRVVQVPRAEEVINNEDLSDVGSSQVPETVENVEIEAGNGRRRKSRGRTTLNELYNRPVGDRAKVSRKVTSRQQQKFTHTAGSKSFARITNDEQLATGTSVGRIKLFDITHTKKDDSPMTSEAAEIMTKLREKRKERSMKLRLQLMVLLIWMRLKIKLLLMFWVLKDMVGFAVKNHSLSRQNILDLTRFSTCHHRASLLKKKLIV